MPSLGLDSPLGPLTVTEEQAVIVRLPWGRPEAPEATTLLTRTADALAGGGRPGGYSGKGALETKRFLLAHETTPAKRPRCPLARDKGEQRALLSSGGGPGPHRGPPSARRRRLAAASRRYAGDGGHFGDPRCGNPNASRLQGVARVRRGGGEERPASIRIF